jgi:hypothetical protein
MITVYVSYKLRVKKKGKESQMCLTCDRACTSPFCPQCGSKSEAVKSTTDEMYTYDDFTHENEEFIDDLVASFGRDGREYLIPNQQLKYTHSDCGPINVADMHQDTTAAIHEFMERYSSLLSRLSTVFEDVKIEYGYILNQWEKYFQMGYQEDGQWPPRGEES